MAESQATNPPAGLAAPGPLEAESDDWDGDSAVGADDLASFKASIGSSILKYRVENGRTYHAYKTDNTPSRMTNRKMIVWISNTISFSSHSKEGCLFSAPIPKEQTLHRVLGVGTGTRIWAVDFTDEHPETGVIGVDLSPIQPKFVPPNVVFEINDLEETWTFNKPFDFIMARTTLQFFAGHSRYCQQAFEHLNPGGWIECIDVVTLASRMTIRTFKKLTFGNDSGHYMAEAARKMRGSSAAATRYKAQLEAAGFVNVNETIYKWPSNRWLKNQKFKELGMWINEDIQPSLEGLSYAAFTRGLGWSKEETEVFLAAVRKDMNDTKIHAYGEIYAVSGQKPS